MPSFPLHVNGQMLRVDVDDPDMPLLYALRDILKLKGLMSVPPFLENPEEVRPYFKKLRELAAKYELTELSMGMTHDFEVAIEEGATMVRIGTGLFGKRL